MKQRKTNYLNRSALFQSASIEKITFVVHCSRDCVSNKCLISLKGIFSKNYYLLMHDRIAENYLRKLKKELKHVLYAQKLSRVTLPHIRSFPPPNHSSYVPLVGSFLFLACAAAVLSEKAFGKGFASKPFIVQRPGQNLTSFSISSVPILPYCNKSKLQSQQI